jgi:predicted ester cyclase
MNKIEIVKAAFDLKNPEQATHYADSFQGTDSVGGQPMDKASWTGMGELLKASIPDLDHLISEIKADGDDVLVTSRFTGTFVNDLDLSAMGLGVLKATGKALEFPVGTARVTFEGDKIKEVHDLSTGPDAGMAGFLKVFGVNMG